MWTDTSCRTHRFHHIGDCWFSNWWITIPDTFFLRVEFCWQFPWSLEQAIQFGINMRKKILNCCDGQQQELLQTSDCQIGLKDHWVCLGGFWWNLEHPFGAHSTFFLGSIFFWWLFFEFPILYFQNNGLSKTRSFTVVGRELLCWSRQVDNFWTTLPFDCWLSGVYVPQGPNCLVPSSFCK